MTEDCHIKLSSKDIMCFAARGILPEVLCIPRRLCYPLGLRTWPTSLPSVYFATFLKPHIDHKVYTFSLTQINIKYEMLKQQNCSTGVCI